VVDQPHGGKEPEQAVQKHGQVAHEVVATLDVDQFMHEDRLKLIFAQFLGHSIGKHDDRLPGAPYAGLDRVIRD